MSHPREPRLKTIKISDLRPTQITVGIREVNEKRKRWKAMKSVKSGIFLGSHMIPVILGPKGRSYVIDHHHLARALHEEGVGEVATVVVANLSKLSVESFWVNMDNRNWMHPYDADGKYRGREGIPKSIDKLVDDPYRSLAGELRRLGGFAKDTTPFSEFLWADFLRPLVKRKSIESDFDHALNLAMEHARSKSAEYLPGWCGPSISD